MSDHCFRFACTREEFQDILKKSEEEFKTFFSGLEINTKEEFIKEREKEMFDYAKRKTKEKSFGDFDILGRMLSCEDPSTLVGNDFKGFIDISLKCFVEYIYLILEEKKTSDVNWKHNAMLVFLWKLFKSFTNKEICQDKFEKAYIEWESIIRNNLDEKEVVEKLKQLSDQVFAK